MRHISQTINLNNSIFKMISSKMFQPQNHGNEFISNFCRIISFPFQDALEKTVKRYKKFIEFEYNLKNPYLINLKYHSTISILEDGKSKIFFSSI